MSLAQLLADKFDLTDATVWVYAHSEDHDEIRQAAVTFNGSKLNQYILDPIPQDRQKWMRDHQSAHDEMNAALGLTGIDISVIDLEDPQAVRGWLWQNFVEHLAARSKMAI